MNTVLEEVLLWKKVEKEKGYKHIVIVHVLCICFIFRYFLKAFKLKVTTYSVYFVYLVALLLLSATSRASWKCLRLHIAQRRKILCEIEREYNTHHFYKQRKKAQRKNHEEVP